MLCWNKGTVIKKEKQLNVTLPLLKYASHWFLWVQGDVEGKSIKEESWWDVFDAMEQHYAVKFTK